MRQSVAFIDELLAPSGKEYHGRRRREFLYRSGHPPSVHVGHTEVRNDYGEWFLMHLRRIERIDGGLSRVRGNNDMTVACQRLAERSENQRVIVHHEDAHG